MFFYLSKIVAFFIWPSSVVTMLLVAGIGSLVLGRALKWGRRAGLAGVALLLACGFGPVGNWLMLPLEERFARGALPDDVAGILILGGFEIGSIGNARGELALNEAAERLTEGILVALKRPGAKVAFSGDDGTLFRTAGSAANTVRQYLEAVGIARQRIVLESRSRTTYENALYLKEMLKPEPGQRFVLVTSAFHMPRSVGTFRKLGFDVIPWPTDYRTRGMISAFLGFPTLPQGLEAVDVAFKEWIGLLGYWGSGRLSALWPGPEALIFPPDAATVPRR